MAFINKKDFMVVSTIPKSESRAYFECDDLIAPAISLLNKKGYRTRFCCSGHPFPHLDSDIVDDISLIDDTFFRVVRKKQIRRNVEKQLKKYDREDLIDSESDLYIVSYTVDHNSFYVSFERIHEFETSLPEIFYSNYCEVSHQYGIQYNYMDEQCTNFDEFERVSRIYEVNKIFYEWVCGLRTLSKEEIENVARYKYNDIKKSPNEFYIEMGNVRYTVDILDNVFFDSGKPVLENVAYIDMDYFYVYRGEVADMSQLTDSEPGLYKLSVSETGDIYNMISPPKTDADKKRYNVSAHIHKI